MRIYQETPLSVGSVIDLDAQATHHVGRVMRLQTGEPVIIFNGSQPGEYLGVITHISKKNITVRLDEYCPRTVESPLNLILAQGIARGEKMDYIIQKAVELGVSQIIPLMTERSTVKLDAERQQKRLQHWQAIAISACEQSGRTSIPLIAIPQLLNNWLQKIETNNPLFVLSPHVKKKLAPAAYKKAAAMTVLIGPEGGLSEGEINAALQKGFIPLNLGPRILRTETATIAALTALQCFYGDLI